MERKYFICNRKEVKNPSDFEGVYMKKNHLQLIEILNAYIKGTDFKLIENVDWDEVKYESYVNNISNIIYRTIKKSKLRKKIPSDTLDEWENNTILIQLREVNQFKEIKKVIRNFNEKQLDIILLKGIIIRNFYNRPEDRVMADGDMLIRECDIDKCKSILIDLGYSIENIENKHEIFVARKAGCKNLEIHRTIRKMIDYKLSNKFEKELWEAVVTYKFNHEEFKGLSLEYLLIHSFFHMARHFESLGFGIRHLLDLVMIINANENNINWEFCFEKLREFKLEKFSKIILGCCKKLFSLNIEEINEEFCRCNDELINEVIDDIFQAGVFGRKENETTFQKSVAKENREHNFTIIQRINMYLFPDIRNMSYKYNYAKKYKSLILVAWIHRFINGIISKEYNFKSKIKFVKAVIKPKDKRKEILNELELI